MKAIVFLLMIIININHLDCNHDHHLVDNHHPDQKHHDDGDDHDDQHLDGEGGLEEQVECLVAQALVDLNQLELTKLG